MKIIKKQTIKNVAHAGTGFFYYSKLIIFLLILTIGLLTARIYFSNQLAISGARVSYYENKIGQLKADNSSIENQLSQKSSLAFVDSKASQLGLVKLPKVQVVKSTVPVALSQ
ncbi:MAG TPA: hypothetical protein VLE47_00960 [Candidatus Saccharimonadales bacterium]|nr:hypothetical protein [Candidatus Saccharimonadales bacterium]